MRKLLLSTCAMFLSMNAFAMIKPPVKLKCQLEQATLEAEMKFKLKDKGRKVERQFDAKLKVDEGQGFAEGDSIAVVIDDFPVGEIVLDLEIDDDETKLAGKLKFKKESEFPAGFPVIKEGSIGSFNGLACIFLED